MFISIYKFYFQIQIFLSYLGLFPFVYAHMDLVYFKNFNTIFIKDFLIFYSLLIFTFIGSIHWTFKSKSSVFLVFYGFFPSLFSTIIIFLNLIGFEKNILLFILTIFFLSQLIIDFIICRKKIREKIFFYKARLPVTIILMINLVYFISV